jgi:hypothetical protein
VSVLVIAIALGFALAAVAVYLKVFAGWRRAHQAILGGLTMFYGMWLALCTGTVWKLVVPGVGSVVLGSASGAGLGFVTFLVVGTVGVATGGIGISFSAAAMVAAGAVFGAVGGAAGASLARVPLVSPLLWLPVLGVGIYLVVGAIRRRRPLPPPAASKALPPDA